MEVFFQNTKLNLESYEKFIFLRDQLYGGPRDLVDSIDVEKQSYETAVDLLEEFFSGAIRAKFDLLSKLQNLKLQYNSDPYSFVGEIRTLRSSADNLKLTVDEVLQYFIWSAMNEKFQDILIILILT